MGRVGLFTLEIESSERAVYLSPILPPSLSPDIPTMCCRETFAIMKHVMFGILLGLFNFLSSLINIYYLYQEGQSLFASLSLFLLWFPGIITSITFIILYSSSTSESHVEIMKKKNVLLYPACLLLFYPPVPIALTIAYLWTHNEKHHERATMSKFFAGFLDHGPHFVLRLVVVVLIGLSQGGVYQRDDYVFILSMVTSFLAFMWTALMFNERQSSFLRWFFLSGPMYAAIFACRAFTLAVFLRETLYNDRSDASLAIIIIALMVGVNVTIFRVCGQDWVRSTVFGL